MIISATGIVIDHYGDVLLIQRDDTRTLAPPGGAAEIGELPPETAAREVREETGLIIEPVRLVGLYYVPAKPDYLSLLFRCIMRGGEITTSNESLHAGFFKTNPYPRPMLDFHKERIQNSLIHQGGPPYWGTQELPTRLRIGKLLINRIVYPWMDFRRRRKGLPAYQPPPRWEAHVSTIFRDKHGHILWTKSKGSDEWVLPGGASVSNEAPWDTAVRSIKNANQINMKLIRLSGIYPAKDKAVMAFNFLAEFTSGQPVPVAGYETSFFAVEEPPESARRQHVLQVEDAFKTGDKIQFRLIQTGVSIQS